MKIRILFNQYFTSISGIMEDLKRKHGEEIYIIGTSKNPNHAFQVFTDKFIVETWVDGYSEEETEKNYIEWMLDTCKKEKVNVFFVKKKMEMISKHIKEFEEIGVKIVCEDYETVRELDIKSETYKKIGKYNDLDRLIPIYYCGEQYRNEICNIISDETIKWILKFDRDEGGTTFRRIVDTSKLHKYSNKGEIKPVYNLIDLNELTSIIKDMSDEQYNRILFMEELESPELSVDCYNSKKGFIAVCRSKLNARIEEIYNLEFITELCEKIHKIYNFKFGFNVQFRLKRGYDKQITEDSIRLLEINPRLSGGSYYTTAIGLNMAEVILADITDNLDWYNIEDYRNFERTRLANVERVVKL